MRSTPMVPMFIPEWEQQCRRERAARIGIKRFVTYRSLVYMNPETGAQMRTRPIPSRHPGDMRGYSEAARKAGYVPCYINAVTLDVAAPV